MVLHIAAWWRLKIPRDGKNRSSFVDLCSGSYHLLLQSILGSAIFCCFKAHYRSMYGIDFLFIAHLKIRLWQCAQFEVNAWCCAGQKLLRSDTLWQKQIRQKWLKSAWILHRCSLTHNLKLAHLHAPSSEFAEAWTPFERFVQGGGQHLALVLTISYLVVSTKCCRL